MIVVNDLSVRAGEFKISGMHMEIPSGKYGVLMGRTGCGKTTLLEAICGLRAVTAGTIRLLNQDVTWLKPAERGIGYVPQDRALFQTMSVRENLAFALTVRRWKKEAQDARVIELAELLGVTHLLERRTQGLSGGEAQRVALGRALAAQPALLLLDEPLSALDDQTRREMYELLGSVRKKTGVTTLHVTHSREEADILADKLFVLENGAVRERADFKPSRAADQRERG